MLIRHPLVPDFIDLCDLPAIDEGLAANTLAIQISSIQVYNYGRALAVTLDCTNQSLAETIAGCSDVLMTAMVRLNLVELYVTIQGDSFTFMSNTLFYFGILNDQDVDINGLFNTPDPVYMIAMESEQLIWANPAAVSANQKTFQDFIGDNVACLNYPDELAERKRLLRKDGQLINYECNLMHWYNDEEKWRRKEVEIVVDIQKIDFWGTECRLGVELMVEETNRFID
ncbi:MAG: hypothetical protein J7647_07750 [Cyanobacteria bacterium SBLK]|nr:hypothetical protein [Cyanobacteria bacterium SBLK]